MDCNESKRKISYYFSRGFRNHKDNSNSFCRPGRHREEISEEHQDIIELTDQLVHETSPPEEGQAVSDEDVAFHTGLCQAGITTEALEELGGCDILPDFTPELDDDDDD
jgi:hypothetical protein